MTTSEGRTLYAAWVEADYGFTPQVRAAYLAMTKAQVQAELIAAGQTVPEDFLKWIDSDPIVEATVYGSPQGPVNVLRVLRSLDLDLGAEVVRKQYTQLALAMAVANAAEGPSVDLSPRQPIDLTIPPNPLKPVDTRDPNRQLDVNDYIINFLADHPVEYEDKQQPARMVEVQNPTDPSQPLMIEATAPEAEPIVEKRTRPMAAWEVMDSKEIQAEFNAYMKEHGFDVHIECETPRRSYIPHPDREAILAAAQVFRDAYIAKGLLPAARDAKPTPAEYFAYLIRNDQFQFPAELDRHWPLFPLNAPWPVLTYLAQSPLPLREGDDLWARYRDGGVIHTYGHYVGNIAQNGHLLAARSLAPFDFGYGSEQMMLKDGGVCGVMAGISTTNKLALGVPAITAGQPGHCALVVFRHDEKTGNYGLFGEQFITGAATTTPHALWLFEAKPVRKPMVYHSAVAWMINYDFAAGLDTSMVYRMLQQLPEADRAAHGLTLIQSALARNPYNLALVDAAQTLAPTADQQIAFWQALQPLLADAAKKSGCPTDSLYSQTVTAHLMARLVTLPVPENRTTAQEIYDWLKSQKQPNYPAQTRYQTTLQGLTAMLTNVESDLQAHLSGQRNPTNGRAMADKLAAAAAQITDKTFRKAWGQKMLGKLARHEIFIWHHRYRDHVVLDPAATAAAKIAGQRLAPRSELIEPRLDEIAKEWQNATRLKRDPKHCDRLAGKIRMLIPQVRDMDQRNAWRRKLLIITGHRPDVQNYRAMIETADWRVVSASRQNKRARGHAANAIDGNPNTLWLTDNGPEDAGGLPQEIVIDLGQDKTLRAFTYLPSVNVAAGMVDQWAVYTSTDARQWTLATEKTFNNLLARSASPGRAEQVATFAPVVARYVKFVAQHVVEGDSAVVAELGIIEASS
ncbi:discoidin domain-containing protein [Planctomycetales bacterium ZRK34]|nr:discoidin domain-containing protein [Planctomycetales bacterium ZRK34]